MQYILLELRDDEMIDDIMAVVKRYLNDNGHNVVDGTLGRLYYSVGEAGGNLSAVRLLVINPEPDDD